MDTSAIKDLARRDLIDALDTVPGPKLLVIDPDLSGPLSLIAEFSLLKEHGVHKIYLLQTLRIETDITTTFYVIRPKIKNVRTLAEQIRNTTAAGSDMRYHVLFVSQRTTTCIRELEEQGVFGQVTVGDYNLDLVPLEQDVLSLEHANSFKDIFLDGDTTAVYRLAKALAKLQAIYGEATRVMGKGVHAKMIESIMRHSRSALAAGADASGSPSPQIDSMIIFDRSVDLVTLLCTQLTYEGLIDEFVGINSTFVEVDSGAMESAAGSGGSKTRRMPLSSSDPLFGQLRDLNFAAVGSTMSKVARRIHDDYEGRRSAKTMSEVRDFVGKLGGLQAEHQSLRLHTNLAERIARITGSADFTAALEIQQNLVAGVISSDQMDYVEEAIARERPFEEVCRLIALASQIMNGIKPKTYDLLRHEIIQTYGFERLAALQNLERSRLIRKTDANDQPAYTTNLRKSLRLTVDDVDEHNPKDAAYVYSGYAPITARLVELAFRRPDLVVSKQQSIGSNKRLPTWRGNEDVLKLVAGGPAFEWEPKAQDSSATQQASEGQRKVILVVFVGGCTYAEISALRFLSHQSKGAHQFVVITTDLLSSPRLIKSMEAEPI